MRIDKLLRPDGPGMSIIQVIERCPDRTATLADIKEALRWAEIDGRVIRMGSYYWRNGAN